MSDGRGEAVRVVADAGSRLWGDGRYLAGGAPWGLVRLAPAARGPVERLHRAGPPGAVPRTATERRLVDALVARGLAHPLPVARPVAPDEVAVVVPTYGRPDLLDACLGSLGAATTVVVDDASPYGDAVAAVARAHGARLVRREVNGGPAAARDTGLAVTDAPVVAFLDSDCTASPGWLAGLVAHLDDAGVGIVAPRVRPRPAGRSVLARYEDARSALDMGPRPALVRPGGRLGFLPAAAMVVRRAALPDGGFREGMRVGEDVDLVWRVGDAGWHVRYEPGVVVHHEMRLDPRAWAARRFAYGTSAAVLDRHHPGRLAPARVAWWNATTVAAALARRPVLAAASVLAAGLGLARAPASTRVPITVAGRLLGHGLLADLEATGHALRREWWPLGWGALATVRRSRVAALAAATLVVPVVAEHVRQRPRLDPLRYLVLRLLEDAAYGSGVLAGALCHRRPRPLLPTLRRPTARRG